MMKLRKEALALGLTESVLGNLTEFLTVYAATPVGSIVVSWIGIDLAVKIGWLPSGDGDILKAIVTGDAVLGALGGTQGVLAGVAGLAGLGKGLGSAPAAEAALAA